MMKKWQVKCVSLIVLFVMMAVMVSGCGKSSSGEKGELSIYYLSSNTKVQRYILDFSAIYPDIKIKEKSFDSKEQMDEVISNELNAGKGPDVIIFSYNSQLDVRRMAKSGAFASLDEFMKEDEEFKPEDYLTGAVEAGKVDGKQYILPLTFRVPILYYNETPEYGLERTAVVSNDQFTAALDKNRERFQEEDDKGAIVYSSMLSAVMAFEDAIRLSDDNRKVEYDEDKLIQLTETVQKLDKELEKVEKISSSFGGDDVELIKRAGILLGFPEDFVHQSWIYNNFFTAAGLERFCVSALSQGDNGQAIGVMSTYGVINADADKSAYEFLRMAMDNNASSGKSGTYDLCLKKSAIKSQIQARKNASSVFKTKSGSIKMEGLPDDVAENLNTIVDQIGEVKILNIRVLNIFFESFDSYFNETKEYTDCLADFKQKMDIYVSE